MAKKFKFDYFSSRIFPHIKAVMDTIPARQPKLTHEWFELREFIYRTLRGVQEPDVPARISIRTAGIQREFEHGVTKKRLQHILDEILWAHLAAIAWYPKEAPLIAEHCFSFFQQNKENLSDEQINTWETELKALSKVVAKYKTTFAAEAREKAERLQRNLERLTGAVSKEEARRESGEAPSTVVDDEKPTWEPPPEKPEGPKVSGFNWQGVLGVILLVAVFSALGWYAYTIFNVPKPVAVTSVLIENLSDKAVTIPLQISFAEYLDNKGKYDGVPVSLAGFLRNRIDGAGNSGVYVYVLVDDLGNEILLKQLSGPQKSVFSKLQTTTDLYNVSGVLSKQYEHLELSVVTIAPSERPTQTISQ